MPDNSVLIAAFFVSIVLIVLKVLTFPTDQTGRR